MSRFEKLVGIVRRKIKMNQLQKVFEYGGMKVRTVLKGNEPWFVAKDVCKILEVSNPTVAISRLDDDEVTKFNLGGLSGESNILNEFGLYSLILTSRKKEAKQFKRWITHEVLPAIRRHGEYVSPAKLDESKTKRAEAMLNNSKTRQAKFALELAEKMGVPEYKEVLKGHAAELITGVKMLPSAMKKTFSAQEIGDQLGISANAVGRLANLHGLKIFEYGQVFYDKAKYCDKQVETWRYYENILPILRGLIPQPA